MDPLPDLFYPTSQPSVTLNYVGSAQFLDDPPNAFRWPGETANGLIHYQCIIVHPRNSSTLMAFPSCVVHDYRFIS